MKKYHKRTLDAVKSIAPGAVVTLTKNGHYRITHPAFAAPIFTPSTPSDKRAWKNFVSHVRRTHRQGRTRDDT